MQHSKSNSKIILYKFCCISFVQSNRFYPTWKTNPSKKLWYNRNNRLKFANIPTWNTKGAWLFIEQIWITINQELNALCQIWMILLERIKMRNIYRSPDRAKNIYNEIKKKTRKKNQKSLLRLNDATHKQSNIGFLCMYTCICSYNGSVRQLSGSNC